MSPDVKPKMRNISNTTFTEREKPIELHYQASISNKVTSLGKETYVSIDFSNDLEALIAEDKRKNDLEVDENILRDYTTEFKIPEGYKVKYLPAPVQLGKEAYNFSVSYTQEGNRILMKKHILMKNQILDIHDVASWNSDLKKLKDINNEQIIITKE